MSVATSNLAALGAPPESGPEVAELELHPVDSVAPPGPVPSFPLRDSPAPELRRRGRPASSHDRRHRRV